MGANYDPVVSREYAVRRPEIKKITLKSLNDDFHEHLLPHIHGDVVDPGVGITPSSDEIDTGTFERREVSAYLHRLRWEELEGRLGISSHKVDEILRRAEHMTQYKARQNKKPIVKGVIKYKYFLGKFLEMKH